MQIYILRHGVAEEAPAGASDADRALTPEGKQKLAALLKAVRRMKAAPVTILTSPYRRAVETAAIAAEALGVEGESIRTKALLPSGSPEEVWNEIRLYRQADEILIAGHEPLLSELTAYLLGAPALQVELKKGAMVCVVIDQFGPRPRGVLRWLITPKLAGAA